MEKVNETPSQLFSAVLAIHPEIVTRVLHCLSARDFISAAKVNTTWNAVASTIRKSRTCLTCTIYSKQEIAKDGNPFWTINIIDQIPSLCLCFVSYELQERLGGRALVEERLRQTLPNKCKILLFIDNTYQPTIEVAKLTFPGPDIKGFNMQSGDNTIDIPHEDLQFVLLFGYSSEGKQAMDAAVLDLRKRCSKLRATGLMLCQESSSIDFVNGVAFYGRNIEINFIFLSIMDQTLEQIGTRIKELQPPINKNCSQSVVLHFSESQRRCKKLDTEAIRIHLNDIPLVNVDVADVLLLADNCNDKQQMVSSVSGWRWEIPPQNFVCDKRIGGPGLVLLISQSANEYY